MSPGMTYYDSLKTLASLDLDHVTGGLTMLTNQESACVQAQPFDSLRDKVHAAIGQGCLGGAKGRRWLSEGADD
jgi:hypothetical protein